jgi:hypothetical protein
MDAQGRQCQAQWRLTRLLLRATGRCPSEPAGTVNLPSRGRNETLGPRQKCQSLCHLGNTGNLSPGLKRLGQGCSILFSWKVVAVEMKEVVDPIMGGEEALRLAG